MNQKRYYNKKIKYFKVLALYLPFASTFDGNVCRQQFGTNREFENCTNLLNASRFDNQLENTGAIIDSCKIKWQQKIQKPVS